jgi:hypothetical protein
MNFYIRFLIIGTIILASCVASAAEKRFALIIANNQSQDQKLPPLSFADDDAARFYELMDAGKAEIRLHAVLDAEVQKRFPQAASVARSPGLKAIEESLDQLFESIRAANKQGLETHFTFYYSGHGHLGPNQEGQLTLLNGFISRSWIFHELLAVSPARYNHLLLDACHAYYVVHKRGQAPHNEGDATLLIQDFLKAEELASYPNTGVLLAHSSSSETHEWGLWEAGIFSHELRSALVGGSDLNLDKKITYLEAAASIEAANSTVPDPKARLQVHVRPPPLRRDVALFDLTAIEAPGWLTFGIEQAGRYHLIDSRGIRVFDIHYSSEQPLQLALLGKPPFYLVQGKESSQVTPQLESVDVKTLAFGQLETAHKGPLEASFKKHLFETAFGLSFLRGLDLGQQRSQVRLEIKESAPGSNQRIWAISSLVLTIASAATAGTFYGLAADSHSKYEDAQDPHLIQKYRTETEDRSMTAHILTGVTGALAVGTTLLWLLDDKPEADGNYSVSPQVTGDGWGFSFKTRF